MIEKKSLPDEVANAMQQKILSGEYAVNSKLPVEPALMETYGVGRSTIREAMKSLSNSGYISIRQGVGTFVQDIVHHKKDINQQFKQANPDDVEEIRQLFEIRIAEKAALNRTLKDIKVISKFLSERNKAAQEQRLQDCIDADINFHIAVSVAARNQILSELYRSASVHVKNSFGRFNNTDSFIKTQKLHQELLDSIISSDSKRAKAAAEKILLRN